MAERRVQRPRWYVGDSCQFAVVERVNRLARNEPLGAFFVRHDGQDSRAGPWVTHGGPGLPLTRDVEPGLTRRQGYACDAIISMPFGHSRWPGPQSAAS
jgi:hypothetical protein